MTAERVRSDVDGSARRAGKELLTSDAKLMVNTFFGQYLLRTGRVTEAQLAEALAFQDVRNRRLGAWAVERGLLTEEQTRELHNIQRHQDRLFGQLAVERGHLDAGMLTELLTLQSVGHMFLGEALITLGHLRPEGFVQAMNELDNLERVLTLQSRDQLRGTAYCDCLQVLLESLEATLGRFTHTVVKLGGICTDATDFPVDLAFVSCFELMDGLCLTCVLAFPTDLAEALGCAYRDNVSPIWGDAEDGDLSHETSSPRRLVAILNRYLRTRLDQRGFFVLAVNTTSADITDSEWVLGQYLLLRMEPPRGHFLLGFRMENYGEAMRCSPSMVLGTGV